MGGSDLFLSELLQKEMETSFGKRVMKKLRKILFEKYDMTLSETMDDFVKIDEILKEVIGGKSKNKIRLILNNFCSLKQNNGKKGNVIILYDDKMKYAILDIMGDHDYREILDVLMHKPLTSYELLDKIGIPQATAYRKIDTLVNVGFLIEDKKIQGTSGRPAIKFATFYHELSINLVKNKITVEVRISRNMLKNSTILSTIYGI